jgi:hypothetical protein
MSEDHGISRGNVVVESGFRPRLASKGRARRLRLALLLGATATTFFAAPGGASAMPITPPPITGPHFGTGSEIGEAAGGGAVGGVAPDGSVYGFEGSSYDSHSEYDIRSFHWTTSAPATHADSPYFGRLVAAAYDGHSNTFVLFSNGSTLKLGERDEVHGTFRPAITVTSGYTGQGADIIARSGGYWAVWSQPVGSGKAVSDQLFQVGPMSGSARATRITPDGTSNIGPSLSFSMTGKTYELAWTQRIGSAVGATIGFGINNDGDRWALSTYPTGGTSNTMPDIAYDGVHTYLAWLRNGVVTESDDVAGTIRSWIFDPSVARPFVAVSDGQPMIGFSADISDGFAVTAKVAAPSSSGLWTMTTLADQPSVINDVFSAGGVARLLVHQEIHDYSILPQS